MSLASALVGRLRLRRLTRCGRRVEVQGRLWVHGPGEVEVGDATQLCGGATGIDFRPAKNARIVIGTRCRVSEGVMIEATELVQLGDRVVVGPWAKILDNDFHPLDGSGEQPPPKPVIIDDDVVIGSRAIILPGVRIQKGARIEDGAVVHRRVAAGARMAGNPATVVKSA